MHIYAHIMGMGIRWFKKITAVAVYIDNIDERMSSLAFQKRIISSLQENWPQASSSSYCICLFLKCIYFERVCVCVCMRACEQGRGRERGEREFQAGSVLSVRSATEGLIPRTMRSWLELKSRVGLRHPGAPLLHLTYAVLWSVIFLFKNSFLGTHLLYKTRCAPALSFFLVAWILIRE